MEEEVGGKNEEGTGRPTHILTHTHTHTYTHTHTWSQREGEERRTEGQEERGMDRFVCTDLSFHEGSRQRSHQILLILDDDDDASHFSN